MFKRKHKHEPKNEKKDESFHFDLNEAGNVSDVDEAGLEDELTELLKIAEADSNKISDDDSVDENDPQLLEELNAHLGITSKTSPKCLDAHQTSSTKRDGSSAQMKKVIHERRENYENQIADLKSKGNLDATNSAKLRRYERSLVSIKKIEDRATSGEDIDLVQLPPPIVVRIKEKHKSGQNIVLDYINQDSSSHTSPSNNGMATLQLRHQQYQLAAVKARDKGDTERALALLNVAKCIAEAIPNIKAGLEPFDPKEDMPPLPEDFEVPEAKPVISPQQPRSSTKPKKELLPPELMNDAISDTVSLKSLNARIALLQALIDTTDSDQNSKKRMYKRLMDLYTQALRSYNADVPFDFLNLANPIGCPKYTLVKPRDASKSPKAHNQPMSTANTRKLELLKQRQNELRSAASQAKSKGDMQSAKELLRASLSMDPMVKAAAAGLPVDLSTLPPGPLAFKKKASDAITGPILTNKLTEPPLEFQTKLMATNSNSQVCDILVAMMEKQADEAEELSNVQRKIGNGQLADKLFDLSNISRQSVSYLNVCKKTNKTPNYAFELANLPTLNVNPDLGEKCLEVTVVRATALPIPSGISGPDSLDTFVTLELPIPKAESPQIHSTDWARKTNEPADYGSFNATARFEVNRKSSSFQRLIQGTKTLKLTMFYNRGILKKYGVLGTVNVNCSGLQHLATVTSSHGLMNGRTPVGGLVELRLRQRTPIEINAESSSIQKPWLIIRTTNSSKKSPPKTPQRTLVAK